MLEKKRNMERNIARLWSLCNMPIYAPYNRDTRAPLRYPLARFWRDFWRVFFLPELF